MSDASDNGKKRIDQIRQSPRERIVRFFRLLRVFVIHFRVFLLWTTIAFVGSTLVLYYVYPKKELPPHHHSLLGTAYDTLQMIFFQSPIPFVDDWRLVPLFFGLPILGMVVIAEGVVHLGNLLFQHRLYTREWQEMVAATFHDHIVVCGLGNVGFRVVQQLRSYGENVVCIERDPESPFVEDMQRYDVPVLFGDARNMQTLREANIDKAKALIAVTNNDLANLESALTAREVSPDIRLVIRMFDQRLAQKIGKSFGIDCAFSASALSAPVFAQAALSRNILSSFEFGGSTVSAYKLEMSEKSPLVGMTVDAVRMTYDVTVLMHEANGTLDWNPPMNIVLNCNDKLLVVSDSKNVQKLLEHHG